MDDFMKFVSNMEQITAMLGEFSRLVAAYYNGLVNSGLSPDQALSLTKTFQTELLSKIFDYINSYKNFEEE